MNETDKTAFIFHMINKMITIMCFAQHEQQQYNQESPKTNKCYSAHFTGFHQHEIHEPTN